MRCHVTSRQPTTGHLAVAAESLLEAEAELGDSVGDGNHAGDVVAGGHIHPLPALPGAGAGVEDGGDRGGAQQQQQGEAGGWHGGGQCAQTGQWSPRVGSESPQGDAAPDCRHRSQYRHRPALGGDTGQEMPRNPLHASENLWVLDFIGWKQS